MIRWSLRVLALALWMCAGVLYAQGVPFGIDPAHQASKQEAGGAFTPADLDDLWAWYDASTFTTDGSTKDGSNNVTKWVNKEGTTARDLTGIGGTPLWTDNAINSLDAIDLERADGDYMYRDVTPPSAPFHVFVVGNPEAININSAAWWAGDSTVNSDGFWLLGIGSGTTGRCQVDVVGTSATSVVTANGPSLNTTHLLEHRETSSASRGVTLDPGTGSEATNTTDKAPAGTNRICVGTDADSTPSQNWDGEVCEVVVCDAVLTGDDLTNLRSYLDAKWSIPGVTGLPPLGPSRPFPWPPLLGGLGLALALLSLRRPRRAGQVLRPEWGRTLERRAA